ncbi:MAG: hypothetical protein LBT60_05260 [Oscillospiraceae bacterium]|jgi:YbbR domain-containing protein|nr:hypothetical protein [Oscillospiraceae bacterium]
MRSWLKKYNIGFWALSLILAVMFWLYVTVNQDAERTKTIDRIHVTFTGQTELLQEKDIVVTSGLDAVISVTLRGRLTELTKCTAETVTVVANLNTITSTGVQPVEYAIRWPDDVQGVRVETPTSRLVRVTTDKIRSRPVDVRLTHEKLQIPTGYKLDGESIDPAQIIVRGPSEVLMLIDHALVAPEKELTQTVVFPSTFTLVDTDGNEITSEDLYLETTSVNVTLNVSMVKEVPLGVNLIDGGGAKAANVQLDFSPPLVELSGDPVVLGPLNMITLGNIDLSGAVDGQTFKFSVVPPNGVANNGKTEAEVTVHFIGLTSQRYDAENITITNAAPPEGYEVRVVTQSLSVTLRGPQGDMSRVQAFSIRIVADLEGVELAKGQQTVLASVYVDGFPDVGAIGEVKITVEVTDGPDGPS